MNTAEPKPAAALSSTLIRRGEGRAVPATLMPPDSPLGHAPADLSIPLRPGATTADPGGRRIMSWRGMGLFGVLYLAALVLFAAAFDMWPKG